MSRVLVTGGAGFLASWCILQLLEAGHSVVATFRDLGRTAGVGNRLRAGGAPVDIDLTVHEADLLSDQGWHEAVAGCDYVLHVASPFPATPPRRAADLIVPARDGTLRVLRAARDAGVKRVVLTSSFAAVGYGTTDADKVFTETDWTDPAAANPPYIRSKTIAERAAWDFIAREGGGLELSVINPAGIFGPTLGPDLSASLDLLHAMLGGRMPGLPDIWFGVVDVRDVADLHLRAMTAAQANGERFIAVAGPPVSMADVAQILRTQLGRSADRVPTRRLEGWKIRLAALVSPVARQTLFNLGKHRASTADKARQVLGWSPRSAEDAILASAESLLRIGVA